MKRVKHVIHIWSGLNNNTMHLPNNRNSSQCTNATRPLIPSWGIHNIVTSESYIESRIARRCCSRHFRGVRRHERQPISYGPLRRSRNQIDSVEGVVALRYIRTSGVSTISLVRYRIQDKIQDTSRKDRGDSTCNP